MDVAVYVAAAAGVDLNHVGDLTGKARVQIRTAGIEDIAADDHVWIVDQVLVPYLADDHASTPNEVAFGRAQACNNIVVTIKSLAL